MAYLGCVLWFWPRCRAQAAARCVRLCGHRVARLTRGGAGDGPALALLNARTAFSPAAMKAYIAN